VPVNSNPGQQFFYTWGIDPSNGSNGTPVVGCGGTNSGPQQCAVNTANLSVGTHVVQVQILDGSGMVKDVNTFLAKTKQNTTAPVQWRLNVAAAVCNNYTTTGAPYQELADQTITGTLSDGKPGYLWEECSQTYEDVSTYDCHGNFLFEEKQATGSPSCNVCANSYASTSFPIVGTDPSCIDVNGISGQYWCTVFTDDYTFACSLGTYTEEVFVDESCVCVLFGLPA
jgi:hypothetical protein